MLDIKLLREHPEIIREALRNRNSPLSIDPILDLDRSRRELLHECEQLKAKQNRVSAEIAEKKKAKQDVSGAVESMRALRERIKQLQDRIQEADQRFRESLLAVPNIPHDSVPIGGDESANRLERTWGEPPVFDFTPKDHVELGAMLGILDLECAAKLSGARFSLLKGRGARLKRALINFMLDVHTREHGYVEIMPPYLVSSSTMEGSGQLPKFADESFAVNGRDLWLVPTAEVPLTNMHRDEILSEEALPLRYTAYTPCFRSEAGSYGKDTRGMMRQHQFHKVELYKFTTPEQSWGELETLTRDAESILQRLGLPYRVVTLSTGDMGFASAKTYDIEVWLPGQNRYREISSCSNCTDFQARRANIRFRRGKKLEYVHTLNGSGLAVGRTFVALLENHQQPDGSVVIPEALRAFADDMECIEPVQ